VDRDLGGGHTSGVKVAVSIPDAIFKEAEALAKQYRTTRSDLYRRALGEFVERHAPRSVTQQMNAALDAIGAERDDATSQATLDLLKQVER
jgi:metal-responsive CopG/Arc/MetJ family transcriptional regulator